MILKEKKLLERFMKMSYATKTDSKKATGIDTSSFAKKFDLGSSKTNADKLDIDIN